MLHEGNDMLAPALPQATGWTPPCLDIQQNNVTSLPQATGWTPPCLQNLKMPGYYRCEVCGINFARKNKLQRHRRRVHGAIVRCPHCSVEIPKHRVDRLAEHPCMGRGRTSLEVAEETESSTTGTRSLWCVM